MKRSYTIIERDGRLLSRFNSSAVGEDQQLNVEFDRDFLGALFTHDITLIRDIRTVLVGAFPDNEFAIVKVIRKRKKYLIDLAEADRPTWIFKAVERFGGTLIA